MTCLKPVLSNTGKSLGQQVIHLHVQLALFGKEPWTMTNFLSNRLTLKTHRQKNETSIRKFPDSNSPGPWSCGRSWPNRRSRPVSSSKTPGSELEKRNAGCHLSHEKNPRMLSIEQLAFFHRDSYNGIFSPITQGRMSMSPPRYPKNNQGLFFHCSSYTRSGKVGPKSHQL